jgi:hypothetical protein
MSPYSMLPVKVELGSALTHSDTYAAQWQNFGHQSHGYPMDGQQHVTRPSDSFPSVGLGSLLPVDSLQHPQKVSSPKMWNAAPQPQAQNPWAMQSSQANAKAGWDMHPMPQQGPGNGRRQKANAMPSMNMNEACANLPSANLPSEPDSSHHYVMLKNIPCRCHQSEILDAVRELGFGSEYEFFYLPLKRINHRQNFGYAFIGFRDPITTQQFAKAMTGYQFGSRRSQKVVEIVPARIQGKQEAVAHFSETKVYRTRWSPIFSGDGLAMDYTDSDETGSTGDAGSIPDHTPPGLMPAMARGPSAQEVPLPAHFFA